MPVTPQITLTATLLDVSGNQIGTATQPAYLRIGLCGYGNTLPRIPGTAMVGQVLAFPKDLPYTGAQITVKLWGNDVITPASTFYSISILDQNKNVIQAGAYQFAGTVTVDLSSLSQFQFPGQGTSTGVIAASFSAVPTIQQASGTVNGVNKVFTFSAGPSPTPFIALYAGGVFQSGTTGDYTLVYSGGNVWTITFTTAPMFGPIIVFWFPVAGSGESTVTAPRTIVVSGLTADHFLYCNFSAPGTWTIPSAASAGAGYELTFFDISYNASVNNITLSGAINGGSSYVINTNGGAVTLHSDGTAWRIKSKF